MVEIYTGDPIPCIPCIRCGEALEVVPSTPFDRSRAIHAKCAGETCRTCTFWADGAQKCIRDGSARGASESCDQWFDGDVDPREKRAT